MTKAEPPRKPNVVIFLIDTLRADRLGVYGYDKPTSPNIDALAAESVVFEQACSAAPWTLPSVVSLLTSTFPCEHGVVVDGQRLSESMSPLAERLKSAGYSTWSSFANGYAGPLSGLDRGHDHWQSERATDGSHVNEWLSRSSATPFYLYIHNVEPHDPYRAQPPLTARFGQVSPQTREKVSTLWQQYRKLTRADFEQKRPVGTTDNAAEQMALMHEFSELKPEIDAMYDATVFEADYRLGTVVQALKRRGVWGQTLFVVLADHGEELGDHGGWQHDQSVYEELVRVPLLVKFPDGEFAGRRRAQPVSLVDLLPTLFDYMHTPELADGCRGSSLMPLIHDEAAADPQAFVVPAMRVNQKKYFRPYRETRGDLNVVVRRGPWKGIWNQQVDGFELYDLASDPGEQHDLSAGQPALVEALRAWALPWLESCAAGGVRPGEVDMDNLDEATRRRLEALGYLSATSDSQEEP